MSFFVTPSINDLTIDNIIFAMAPSYELLLETLISSESGYDV